MDAIPLHGVGGRYHPAQLRPSCLGGVLSDHAAGNVFELERSSGSLIAKQEEIEI